MYSRRVKRSTRAPPALRRACSESARGLTIVSFRIITKFDDCDHPSSTRVRSSRCEGRQGVGTVQCVTSVGLCNSKKKTYLFINSLHYLFMYSLMCNKIPSSLVILKNQSGSIMCSCDMYALPRGDSEQVYLFD